MDWVVVGGVAAELSADTEVVVVAGLAAVRTVGELFACTGVVVVVVVAAAAADMARVVLRSSLDIAAN